MAQLWLVLFGGLNLIGVYYLTDFLVPPFFRIVKTTLYFSVEVRMSRRPEKAIQLVCSWLYSRGCSIRAHDTQAEGEREKGRERMSNTVNLPCKVIL